ncbi:hypothetical protein EI94DRAFT_1700584 [Lactarius quietus]|nr:hypothetical protein EI94DRAFT_1700584 [Lactarius quietus]
MVPTSPASFLLVTKTRGRKTDRSAREKQHATLRQEPVENKERSSTISSLEYAGHFVRFVQPPQAGVCESSLLAARRLDTAGVNAVFLMTYPYAERAPGDRLTVRGRCGVFKYRGAQDRKRHLADWQHLCFWYCFRPYARKLFSDMVLILPPICLRITKGSDQLTQIRFPGEVIGSEKDVMKLRGNFLLEVQRLKQETR